MLETPSVEIGYEEEIREISKMFSGIQKQDLTKLESKVTDKLLEWGFLAEMLDGELIYLK